MGIITISILFNNALELLPPQRRSPIKRMRLLCRTVILLPHLDRFVRLSRDEPQSRLIKRTAHDPSLRIQTPRLRNRILILEAMSGLPVPESHAPIVSTRKEHVVFVHSHGIDDGVVPFKVLHEVRFGQQPLLDLARRSGRKRVLGRMRNEASHTLLVVRQHAHCFSGREVVRSHGAVQAGGDDLGVGRLRQDRTDGLLVTRQDVDVASCAHVPDADDAIAAACAEDVECGVELEGVDARQVAVVVSYYFVCFQVPALDHLVLATGEKVRVAW